MSAHLTEHDRLAAELRRATLGSSEWSSYTDRRDAMTASGEGAVGALARKIAEASFRVKDADVHAAQEQAGSEKGAFEIVLTASIGAGLTRWDVASRAIEEATREAT